ncbi:MipA/OmpV family protein [Endozoicomonas acroporae]|uniref:MipA/OmpV family protein n=1 Tax=Endozoicomonas acroporae TaxID=1701104 RepID=UPI0013D31655|nr:MipA/OmpV family protein [Endozoicomonas acroporae]
MHNDYYYGISSKEAGNNPLLSTYKADAGVDMGLEVMATYQLSSRWLLVGGAEYTRFSSSVTDSQLVDKSNQTSVMAGVAYMF